MLLLAIFFVSFSTLAYEVLLTRVFSIGQWNHLTFMVISIALFGFGASGTFLSLVDLRQKDWLNHLRSNSSLSILISLYSCCAILSFVTLTKMPLDYFRLPVEPRQSLYLLCAYLVLTLPFFFSGLIISIGYTTEPEKAGFIYFASMAGSACGVVFPVPLLPLLGEGKLIIIASLIPLVLSAIFAKRIANAIKSDNSTRVHRGLHLVAVVLNLGILFLSVFLLDGAGAFTADVRPSQYKALSQILQFPETHINRTSTAIRGRIDLVDSPYIRFAPGISLKYTEPLPSQQAIYTDGDNQFVLYTLDDRSHAGFAKFMLSYCGYHLLPDPEHALLIGIGGGTAIPCAVASGVRQLSIVIQNPTVTELVGKNYRRRVVCQSPREFLSQTPILYDIIHLENWGTSIPGTSALDQDHLLTVDAFMEYCHHLTAKGVFIVSRKLLLPPSDSLRLWGTAYNALKRLGFDHPTDHIAILRNWDTFTLLIGKQVLDAQAVIEFARQRNFDLVFLKGMSSDMANKFNVFDEPYHFQKIAQLAKAYTDGKEMDFFETYLLDVTPRSDRHPFPSKFLKWLNVDLLYKSLGNRFYVLLMSGEVVVSVVFVEALLVTIILLFVPLFLITRRHHKPSIYQVVFFFGVGAGFMFVELFFIKQFILLVGNPVISFIVVISGILIFSSLGGLWVYKKNFRNMRLALTALIGVLILIHSIIDMATPHILRTSAGIRYLIIYVILFPTGFLMGLPFPLGMRYLVGSQVQRAYAWSVNGCASVLTSILSAQIAISFGIPIILICAALSYCLALLVCARH